MCRFLLVTFALTVLAGCQPTTTVLKEEQKAEVVQVIAGSWAGFEEACVMKIMGGRVLDA